MAALTHDYRLYVFGFAIALLGSLALTYVVRARARVAGLFDPVDARKLHTEPVPRIGGVAIFLSVFIALAAVAAVFGMDDLALDGTKLLVVLTGGALTHFLGLWDDLRPMRARWKFLGQIAIALFVYAAGVRMNILSLPFVGRVEIGSVAGLFLTVFWLVGITNAFNLIDGLDGLASGAALFSLTTMFIVATIGGFSGAALVTLVLAGATLGFLFYNFHPASIFLGDSGSLFLGFMLAGIGLLSSQKSSTAVAVAIPVVSLGLPVLDTLLAIVRRFLRGQPIFSADRGHIHHRLLHLGHSPKQVALLLYGVCGIFALGAMTLVTQGAYVALVLTVVGLGVGLAIQKLRFTEFEELARLLRTGVQNRGIIGRRVRIREASVKLATITDLDDVFALLEGTFEEDEFSQAEVRLNGAFIRQLPSLEAGGRRREDETPVWRWSYETGTASPEWWEIRLPLLDVAGSRIGSLVLWHDGEASEAALSHVHTIADVLRGQIQDKLVGMWHQARYAAHANNADANLGAAWHSGPAMAYRPPMADSPERIRPLIGLADLRRVADPPEPRSRSGT